MNTLLLPKFWPYLIVMAGMIVLAFNFFVYFRNRCSLVNLWFALFGLHIFVWLSFYGVGYLIRDLGLRMYLFKLGYVGVIGIPFAFLFFVLHILGIFDKTPRCLKLSLLIIYGCLMTAHFTKYSFFDGFVEYDWGLYPAANLIFHPILLLVFVLLFSVSNTLLFLAAFTGKFSANIVQQTKMKYVFCGSICGVLGSIDFLGSYGVRPFFPLGFLFMIPYPFILGYAIVKFRLMQIDLAVTRTGIFIAVYSIVLGIPFALAFLGNEMLIRFFADSWWIVPLVASTMLATVGPFVYLYFDKKAEDRLLKEQRAYHNILRGASVGMIRIRNLERLLNLIVRVVTKSVRVKHASIYLWDKEFNHYVLKARRGRTFGSSVCECISSDSPLVLKLISVKEPVVALEVQAQLQSGSNDVALQELSDQLRYLNLALVVPSFVEERLISILLLGEKISEKPYSIDDLNVFSVLANQAALAIENAQFYDEIKNTHEQLFQAEKLATIGTMADGLSHQINNRFHALSLISGDSLDILKTLDTSHCNQGIVSAIKDVKSGLERIQANVLQGGEVVKGLLKYSRPGEAGFEPVDIRDVVSGAVDMVQYKIKFKEIEFFQNIPEDLAKLRGNLTQLQEVFFNMFDNAYDAIKERQASLKEDGYNGKIEVVASLDDGNLRVVVSDNGMGVKDKDKKNLFTPFFTTKATARKGTGLGLYVIEKIVAAHNGKLSMDSTYQSGTQFTIILPLAGPHQA